MEQILQLDKSICSGNVHSLFFIPLCGSDTFLQSLFDIIPNYFRWTFEQSMHGITYIGDEHLLAHSLKEIAMYCNIQEKYYMMDHAVTQITVWFF